MNNIEQVKISHTFPVSLSHGFSYITGLPNWPDYWPGLVRVEDMAHARWGTPGDQLKVVLRFLTREVTISMELETFEKDSLVIYRSRQRGLPDARHYRHFTAVPEGFEYRILVEYLPRRGLVKIFDRVFVRWVLEKTFRRTIKSLDTIFRQRPASV